MKLLSCAAILLATACASVYHVGTVDVEPTGGAGFAGMKTWELIQEPALSVPAGCTGRCPAHVVADSVDLVPNHHYAWRPALSTGVAFQHYAPSGFGGGLGLNIVLIPGLGGVTAPWPAVTAHLGTHQYGFFAGLVIAPTDGVSLPPGVSSVRVQRDAIPDLVTPNTGKAGHFYFGIRLGVGTAATADTSKHP